MITTKNVNVNVKNDNDNDNINILTKFGILIFRFNFLASNFLGFTKLGIGIGIGGRKTKLLSGKVG